MADEVQRANRKPGFYRLRWRDGRMAVGFLHSREKPTPWDREPREHWSVLFTHDTLIGLCAAYTTTRDIAEADIGESIEWEEAGRAAEGKEKMSRKTSRNSAQSPAAVGVLHVYGQRRWHSEVMIVGNSIALSTLRDAIDDALSGKNAKREFTVSDGEGYQLTVKLCPAPFDDVAWDKCALPYFDTVASGKER